MRLRPFNETTKNQAPRKKDTALRSHAIWGTQVMLCHVPLCSHKFPMLFQASMVSSFISVCLVDATVRNLIFVHSLSTYAFNTNPGAHLSTWLKTQWAQKTLPKGRRDLSCVFNRNLSSKGSRFLPHEIHSNLEETKVEAIQISKDIKGTNLKTS